MKDKFLSVISILDGKSGLSRVIRTVVFSIIALLISMDINPSPDQVLAIQAAVVLSVNGLQYLAEKRKDAKATVEVLKAIEDLFEEGDV